MTGRLNTEVQTYEREGVKKPGENQVASEKKEELSAEEKQKKDDETWGAGANVKFCEDAFFTADEHMLDSCGGKDYCSKFYIVLRLLFTFLDHLDLLWSLPTISKIYKYNIHFLISTGSQNSGP